LDGKNVACGLAGELVSTVAGTDRDGQGVQLRATHEVGGLFGVGQQLVEGQLAVCAVAVFLVTSHGFQRAQTTQFTFNRHAQFVGHFDHLAGDLNVVFVIGNGLAVSFQGTVHHDAGETEVNRALADGGRLAVILVHDYGDVGIRLDSSLNQVFQEAFARIFTCSSRSLHDHGAVGFGRRFHDGLHLFQVVDVESRDTVAVLGCVIQKLTHGN